MKTIIGILCIVLALFVMFVVTCFSSGLKTALIAWGIVLLLTVLVGVGAWLIID